MTLFTNSFTFSKHAVGVPTLPVYLILLPPTVNRVWFFLRLSLADITENSTVSYIISSILWYFSLSMKNNVFFLSTCPGMPWDSRPISFPDDFPHISRYSGLIRRWLHSIISPVSPSKTAPAISHNNFIGNFRDANCLGVAGVLVSSMDESMTSWVSVLRWDLVLFAGVSP